MTDYYRQMERWEEKQRFRKGVVVVCFMALFAATVWAFGKMFNIL